MSKIIFLMAATTGAAGLVLVALGIPIQEFGLGNTLIGSGITAVVGGLVLFALAAVLREVQGIGRILQKQTVTAKSPEHAMRHDDAPAAASAQPSFVPVHESAPPAEAVPSSERIVKSGVVDGLAYTLYADGSIDAELEEGTLRFVSVDDLQAYLRKSA